MGAHFLYGGELGHHVIIYCLQSRGDMKNISENVKTDRVFLSGVESSPPLHTIALANRIRNRQQSHDVTTGGESGDGPESNHHPGIRHGSLAETDQARNQGKNASVKHSRSQR